MNASVSLIDDRYGYSYTQSRTAPRKTFRVRLDSNEEEMITTEPRYTSETTQHNTKMTKEDGYLSEITLRSPHRNPSSLIGATLFPLGRRHAAVHIYNKTHGRRHNSHRGDAPGQKKIGTRNKRCQKTRSNTPSRACLASRCVWRTRKHVNRGQVL